MRRYLGVDGGGTKTAFVLLTDAGDILAETVGDGAYYFTEGLGLVDRVLAAGVTEVCREAGVVPGDIDRAFFGLPTYGEVSADVAALDAAPRGVLGHDRYSCDNDMVCGWAGSLAGADGINVISGTGSMTYGENGGRGLRVGGWGELFGDEGSGYWVAVRGLEAFSRMSDGRLPAGPLQDALREALDLDADLDAVDVVLNRWQGDRGRIAALSRPVVAAAGSGDEVAAGIVRDAAAQLVELVDATRRGLGFAPDESVTVSYSGGMFGVPALLASFEEALAARHPQDELRTPAFGPAVGAALYAARQDGHPLGDDALARLRSA